MKPSRPLLNSLFCFGASLILCGQLAHSADEPATADSGWPLEPTRFILQTPGDRSDEVGPYIAPKFRQLADDPLDTSKSSKALHGLLVYAPYSSPRLDSNVRLFFTLRHLGSLENNTRGAVANYGGAGLVSEPMFAPDGRAISYKSGDTTYHGFWDLYVWNFDNRTVVQITDHGVSFPLTAWSPDSKRLAYALNGNQVGEENAAPFQLKVADVKDGKSQVIASHLALGLAKHSASPGLAPFCWSSPETVLFGAFDDKFERRSQIYERQINGAKPVKLVDDAYAPIASPDNRWIAFLRESAANKLPGVFLFERATKKVVVAKVSLDAADSRLTDVALRWTPDGKKLVVLQSHLGNGRTKQSQTKAWINAQIVEPDINPRVTKLPVWNVTTASMASSLPITARQITRDGRTLILQRFESVENKVTGGKMLLQAMLGMDLSSGAVEPLIEFKPVAAGNPTMRGWDWLDAL